MSCGGGTCSTDTTYRKLTLKRITRIGKYDGSPPTLPALPPTTFTYGSFGYTAVGPNFYPNSDWNRLKTVDNGEGGLLTFGYETIGKVLDRGLFINNRRVISKTVSDGIAGHQPYVWTYSYGTTTIRWDRFAALRRQTHGTMEITALRGRQTRQRCITTRSWISCMTIRAAWRIIV